MKQTYRPRESDPIDPFIDPLIRDAFVRERLGTTADDEGLAPLKDREWISTTKLGADYGEKWVDYFVQYVGVVLHTFAKPATIEQAFQFVQDDASFGARAFPIILADSLKLVQVCRARIFHRRSKAYLDIRYADNHVATYYELK